MTHIHIRLPYVEELFKCDECGELWAVYYNVVEVLYNRKRIQAHLADVELGFAVHRTNHVLERLHKEVFK